MEQFNLDPEILLGYIADNRSVNYCIHNSIFKKLLEKHSETKIIKIYCNRHVIHNAARITIINLHVI